MSLEHLNLLLRSHELIQDLKLRRELREEFAAHPEDVLDRYDLMPEERAALLDRDFKALYELGVHPYLLAQLSRVFFGNAEGEATSDAAVALVRSYLRDQRE